MATHTTKKLKISDAPKVTFPDNRTKHGHTSITLSGNAVARTASAPVRDPVVYSRTSLQQTGEALQQMAIDTYGDVSIATNSPVQPRVTIQRTDRDSVVLDKENKNLRIFLDEVARVTAARALADQTPLKEGPRAAALQALNDLIFLESERWGENATTLGERRYLLTRGPGARQEDVKNFLNRPKVQAAIALRVKALKAHKDSLAGEQVFEATVASMATNTALTAHPNPSILGLKTVSIFPSQYSKARGD